MLVDPRTAGVGVERPPVSGCRIISEPDSAPVYEHRVYESYLLREGQLPTATGHGVDAADPAVLRCRIPHNPCRIHSDAMGIGACRSCGVLTEAASSHIELAYTAVPEIGIPHGVIRGYGNIVKLDLGPRYAVVHDSSTRWANWSRNARHNLVERTAATGWGLLSASTGEQQAQEPRAPPEPLGAASRRHEALIVLWCNHGALKRAPPNGARLSCAAKVRFSQIQFYYDGRRQLQPRVRQCAA
jgi:hypothetical protein